jgi:putative tricarboxylic transport membrane protein
MLTMVGAYSVRNSMWDVGAMIVFGVIGYIMKKLDIPIAAAVLTFVLGSQMETSLVQSLITSNNGLMIFFTRPISGTIMAIVFVVLALGIVSTLKNKRGMLSSDVEI